MKNGNYKEDDKIVWYKDDKIHREDGPAIEYNNGCKEWWFNGNQTLEANIYEFTSASGRYVLEDKTIMYFKEGLAHNENGPAIEGEDFKEWWINGKKLTEQEFKEYIVKKNLHEKLQSNLEPKNKEKMKKI